MAAANRASSRRSQCTCEPSPGGKLYANTSTTPPSVSPSECADSISVIIAALVSASAQRTGSSSIRFMSPSLGSCVFSGTRTEPIDKT